MMNCRIAIVTALYLMPLLLFADQDRAEPGIMGSLTGTYIKFGRATTDMIIPPDYGWAVVTSDNEPVELFGSTTLVEFVGDTFAIDGYEQPADTKIVKVGSKTYTDYYLKLQEQVRMDYPSGFATKPLRLTASKISEASLIISNELCPNSLYPTEVTLSLNSELEVVFYNLDGAVGMSFNMEDMCSKYDKKYNTGQSEE